MTRSGIFNYITKKICGQAKYTVLDFLAVPEVQKCFKGLRKNDL